MCYEAPPASKQLTVGSTGFCARAIGFSAFRHFVPVVTFGSVRTVFVLGLFLLSETVRATAHWGRETYRIPRITHTRVILRHLQPVQLFVR